MSALDWLIVAIGFGFVLTIDEDRGALLRRALHRHRPHRAPAGAPPSHVRIVRPPYDWSRDPVFA